MTNVYSKQIEDLEKIVPNFKVASSIIHYDETSPHIHIVGVPIKDKNKNGMSKQVGKSDVFTKSSLTKIQDKMILLCIEEFNKEYGLSYKLKSKEVDRNEDINVKDMNNYIEMKKEIKKNKVIRNLVEENSKFHREIDELNEKIYDKCKESLDKDLVIAKLEDENTNLKQKLKYYVDKFKKLVNHYVHKMFKKDREIYHDVAIDLYEHDILEENELKDIRFNYIESHSNSYENKDKDDFEL